MFIDWTPRFQNDQPTKPLADSIRTRYHALSLRCVKQKDTTVLVAGLDIGSRHDRSVAVALNGDSIAKIAILPVGLSLSEQAAVLLPILSRCGVVCIDATGIGLGIAEELTRMLPPGVAYSVIIGSGAGVTETEPQRLHVGKEALIRYLMGAVRQKTIRMRPDLPNAQVLMKELSELVAKPGSRGRCRFEGAGLFDDCGVACGLAILAREIHGKAEKVRRAGAH